MDQIASAEFQTIMQSAHVLQDKLDHHHSVDQSVLLVLSVHSHKLASIANVQILVLVFVVLEQDVM